MEKRKVWGRMIELAGVSHQFRIGKRGKERVVPVLHDINLKVEKGEIVAIVGRSGSGKSTLLQIMAGLTTATSGEVFYRDRKVEGPPPDVLYVFQQYTRSLFPWKTGTFSISGHHFVGRESSCREMENVPIFGHNSHRPEERCNG